MRKNKLLKSITLLSIALILIFTNTNLSIATNNKQNTNNKKIETKNTNSGTSETVNEKNKEMHKEKKAETKNETKKEKIKEPIQNEKTIQDKENTITGTSENSNGNIKEIQNKKDIKMFGRNNRQFLTFTTQEGQLYYILIDYNDKGVEQNVEILRKINNSDIEKIQKETFNEVAKDKEKSFINEETKEDTNTKDNTKNTKIKSNNENKILKILSEYGIYIFVVIATIIGYFIKKKRKNKNNLQENYIDEDYFDDDENISL
ncbi:CD1107 family mobile element protein [Helcococcus bovis]|uniref:CD1107 family mobile element protein n=1 Tax=Helcococcus bovis TaxID=3153252 RepID=UPI0038B81E40